MNHYELTDKNHPAPPRPQWFDTALRQIASDHGIEFRLVWGPDVEAFRWGAKVKLYAAYAMAKHAGWYKARYVPNEYGGETLKRISYHPVGAFKDYSPEAAHRLDDSFWLLPDITYWHVAYPRWIVEKRAPERERLAHEANRYEWDVETGERVDALGPWPEGGRWYNFYVVAQHVVVCCEQANAEGRLCYGIGRDPNAHDLDYVRKAVAAQIAAPMLPEPGSQDWNRQYSQNVKAAFAEHAEASNRQKENYRQRMRNVIDPTLGKAVSLDTTLPETISTAPPIILDPFQRAARDHMLELERKGDTYDGRSS